MIDSPVGWRLSARIAFWQAGPTVPRAPARKTPHGTTQPPIEQARSHSTILALIGAKPSTGQLRNLVEDHVACRARQEGRQ